MKFAADNPGVVSDRYEDGANRFLLCTAFGAGDTGDGETDIGACF